MIGTCLTAKTVMPHTVLFATKGTRIAVYIGQTGTDFLALLHSKRHLMARAQTLKVMAPGRPCHGGGRSQ